MLSHVNKRVRGHDQIKLPLDALLDLYLAEASVPLVKNFAVVYVEMAMDRSTQEQQAAAVRSSSCTSWLLFCNSCCLACCIIALVMMTFKSIGFDRSPASSFDFASQQHMPASLAS